MKTFRLPIALLLTASLFGVTGCTTAANGQPGDDGPSGAQGEPGTPGADGSDGEAGAAGPAGPRGMTGPVGPRGASGADGAAGAAGSDGADGSGDASLFYALMPADNAAMVAPGAAVSFPQDGPSTTGDTMRTSASQFTLGTPGIYRVSVQVSVTEAGQLVVALDGTELAYTVAGRATGTSQIIISTLVETTVADQVLSVRNPASSGWALSITPLAGGSTPVAATLLIEIVEAS